MIDLVVPLLIVEAHKHRFHLAATVTLVSLKILESEIDLLVHQFVHILRQCLYTLLLSNLQGMLLCLGQQIV